MKLMPGFRLIRDSEAEVAWNSPGPELSSTEAAVRLLRPFAAKEEIETCWVLPLDQRNRLITSGPIVVSRGSVTESCLNPSLVFRPAIAVFAVSVIVAHSHPGGVAEPSSADYDVTNDLRQAGELLGIELLDHIILAPRKGVFSFAKKGW